MLKKLDASGLVDVKSKLRALPRSLTHGDFFSGAGTFFKVIDATMYDFRKIWPKEYRGLEANVMGSCSFFICLNVDVEAFSFFFHFNFKLQSSTS